MTVLRRLLAGYLQTLQPRVCEECGGSLAGRRSDTRWCSDACRMQHQRRLSQPLNLGAHYGLRPAQHTCPICGVGVTSQRATYCGPTCRKRASRSRQFQAGLEPF
jgi:predicted nucleic acid-binding Zn ribbon protein